MWPQRIATIGIAAALGIAAAASPVDARHAAGTKHAGARASTSGVVHIGSGPRHGFAAYRSFWSSPPSGAYAFDPTACYASHPYVMHGRQYWQLDYVC
jgi:hypothetical protein